MKYDLEITELETVGDNIRVGAQGAAKRQAAWRPLGMWRFEVPEYIGKHYRIGQKIRAEMK